VAILNLPSQINQRKGENAVSNFKKLLLTVCTILAVTSVLAACHTMQGAGKDMQSGGKALEKAASE
jgi:predicted small secreted protein